MRHAAFVLVLALGVMAQASRGGPLEGSFGTQERIPESHEGTPGTKSFSQAFMAGQRACVIVIGDHKPVEDVEVKVFDAKGNLVAQDRGTAPAPDFVAVMWYPPRTETYRIDIVNHGKEYNDCSIAIK